MSPRHLAAWLGALLLVVPAARAQEPPPSAEDASGLASPFYVAAIEGEATLTRNGQAEPLAATQPLIDGDRVRTGRGRLELRNDRGVFVYLDGETLIDLPASDALRVVGGNLRIVVRRLDDGTVASWVRVDSPNATVRFLEDGDYRIDVATGTRGDETLLATLEGAAELDAERGTLTVRAGERAVARGWAPPAYDMSNAGAGDDFDQWVAARIDAMRPTATSSYLPSNIAAYSPVLDRYGSWAAEPEYGQVWYPSVPVYWRPYSYGYWGYAGFYGSVWIGRDPWAWPTHHYGRWGCRRGRWFWMPRPVWGPAWVSWGVGPGYVGWCPLGWDNRPVFSIHVTNVNYYRRGGSYGRYGGGYGYGPGHGWTVVRSEHFRPGIPVWRHAVDAGRIPTTTRGAFVTQRVPPRASLYGGHRTDGGRVAGPTTGYAVPRTGTPALPAGQPGRLSTLGQRRAPTGDVWTSQNPIRSGTGNARATRPRYSPRNDAAQPGASQVIQRAPQRGLESPAVSSTPKAGQPWVEGGRSAVPRRGPYAAEGQATGTPPPRQYRGAAVPQHQSPSGYRSAMPRRDEGPGVPRSYGGAGVAPSRSYQAPPRAQSPSRPSSGVSRHPSPHSGSPVGGSGGRVAVPRGARPR